MRRSRPVETRPISPILSDWAVNAGRPKSQLALLLFRVAAKSRYLLGPRHPLSVVVGVTYRVAVEWILGIEIPWQVQVGPRLRIFHGQAIVINPAAILGADVTLRQGVTIGNRLTDTDCPRVEDHVAVGAYAAVLGDIKVGAGATLGAHAVVLRDVPAGATAVGNPARILRQAGDQGGADD